MYLHPSHIKDELIEVMAQEKRIVPYIEMPIQHAHPKILRSMNRSYSPEMIIDLMEKFRKNIDGCFLRTTVMTGYPGETRREFEFLLQFLQENPFERLGVFVFSPEEGTKAYQFSDMVPEELATDRFDQIMAQQQYISKQLLSRHLGKTVSILPEFLENGYAVGRSVYDAPDIDGLVFLDKAVKIGEIVEAVLEENNEYDYFASVVETGDDFD